MNGDGDGGGYSYVGDDTTAAECVCVCARVCARVEIHTALPFCERVTSTRPENKSVLVV